ncbi:MAG: glycine cleavage system aminomethyltransferase GcvT, partial [Dictyoglomus sp.]
IFDISHMGRILVKGNSAKDFLQHITTNDINKLFPGKAQYSLILNYSGTIMDDIIVFMLNHDEFLLVVNAINTEKVLNWLKQNNTLNLEISDLTKETILLAIQGPKSEETLEKYLKINLSEIKYYHFIKSPFGNTELLISRTGYTGEDGFEILADLKTGKKIFLDLVYKENITPCGLGARDTLRIEMGYPLYGHEIDENTTPWEANLAWVVKLNKGDFIGKKALIEKKDKKTKYLNGFIMVENGIPRVGYEVYLKEEKIGYITSGTFSPILKLGIGMLYTYIDIQNEVFIKIRERYLRAKIEKPPFIKNTSLKKGEDKNVS